MRVRDLGALTITVDGVERPVAGSRAPAILAMLVINLNQRVSVQALLDATWGQKSTGATVSTLESHVWRLRQLLEPDRVQRQPSTVLINENGGYRLVADGHTVDSVSFAEIARDLLDLLSAGRADSALARADEALQLWRGQPYGSLGDEHWAQPSVARLNELRQNTREARIDALISLGRLEQALADLEPMVAGAPFRERLRAQQMTALYRSGRGEEALAVFQRARATLIDELGTEPGLDLRSLHTRILEQDPDLDVGSHPVSITLSASPIHLPPSLTPLVGRVHDVEQLTAQLESRSLVTLTGAAGVGKTRLAVEVGRQLSQRFCDGVWFVDLAAITDAALVVDAVVSTIGIASSPAATPLEDLAHYGRGRRLLLILDNCEHVVDAVVHLVSAVLSDGAARCAVLATSRMPLDVDAEVTWTVPPLALPEPGSGVEEAPAVDLFLDRLGRVNPELVVDDEVRASARAICVAVDGLPLAIELAAARTRSHSLRDVEEQSRTDAGALGRPGHQDNVRSAIDTSYRALEPDAQLVHRRLSVLPGPFTSAAATAVVGDLPAPAVSDALAQLVHRSMLTSSATRTTRGRTVFRQLATVRAHAAHIQPEDDAAGAAARRDQFTASLIASRPRLGMVGEEQWFAALDDDDATVRATLAALLIDRPDPGGARLCAPLGLYWYFRARVTEAARWLRLARDAARGHELAHWTTATLVLCSALAAQGRMEEARPLVQEAVACVPGLPEQALIDVGEAAVILAGALWVHPDAEMIITVHSCLRRIAQDTGDAQLHLFSDVLGCMATAAGGKLDDAAARAAELYDDAVAAGNPLAAWLTAATPMTAALVNNDPDRGIPWVRRVMRAHLSAGGVTAGMFVENRANYESQRGSHLQAARLYAAARAHTRRASMVWPRRAVTGELLSLTREALSRSDFEDAWREGESWELTDIVALD